MPMYRTQPQPQVQGEEKVSGSKELLFPSVQNNDLSVYSPAQLAVQLKNSFVTHPFVIITEKAHMENCLRYILRLVRGLHKIGDNLLFADARNNDLPVYSFAQLAVQLKNSFIKRPFVIITETAHMENFQIPNGAEVTINPLESYHDFGIVLVQYKDALALKRISFRADGGFDLIDSRGVLATVQKDDLNGGLFQVIVKAVSVTYKIDHGL